MPTIKTTCYLLCALAALHSVSASADQHAAPKYDLSVERIEAEIYNPWTQQADTVELRAFRAKGHERLTAPTMRALPGEVLRLNLENKLPACTQDEIATHRCYNSTNIHTHGLWVSPSGNSDNVMLSIDPAERFQYEFVIPEDHPAGTFWYHPHMHGATSVQLGSGMAGALIIDGDRVPTETSPGDIDILFSGLSGEDFGEQIWLFSQIQYACQDAEGNTKRPKPEDPETPPWKLPAWNCDAGETGTVDSFRQFGPFDEMTSGRSIAINGEVHPTLGGVKAGRFERLRMIHAGLRRSVEMGIRKLADDAPQLRSVPASEHRKWIADYCTGDPIEQFHFADDGLTRYSMRKVTETSMNAGSRLDALVYFDEPGRYCVINNQSWRRDPEDYRVLAVLEVGGSDAPIESASDLLSETLANSANRRIVDATVLNRVIADLRDGFKLSAFAWHEPVADEELTGKQSALMSIVEQEDGSAILSIDGIPYDHGRMDKTLIVGDVDEWEITSNLATHPFHIHVNPFQIVSILDEEGRDVTVQGTDAYDPDYAGMLGGWRDTVIIKRNYKITMRTRYRRYVGDFVMHCHFASHGDEGMMQNVRIQTRGDQMAASQMH